MSVTRPQQGRKGLSTPTNMDIAGGVQNCRPDPSHTGGYCFPASVFPLHAPHSQLCTGAGSLEGQGPSSDGGREGKALRGEGNS